MNNVNMGGMNAMGGPVGGGMPMMNNGAAGAGVRQPMPVNDNQRTQLNTYIYEYFLRNEMYECARSLLKSEQPMNIIKDSPGQRRGENGADESGDGDSKDDIDSKRPSDLPSPNLPKECPESCFLYEWWCLFWDMFNAQRGKGDGRAVMQYVSHTQAQSRERQQAQQRMLQGLRQDMPNYQQMMMRNQQNGMQMSQENMLRQKALQNQRNATPQNMQMLAQQKQNAMQRDPSDGNNQQRPQSPGSAENAPSPSKRPRLDGTPFNPQQMPNGRGQPQGMPQQVGDTGPSNAIQAAHLQLTNGIEPNNLTAQQFPNIPGGPNANAQAGGLAGYQQNLARQQANQMPVKPMQNQGGPQNQGSPMMTQGPEGGNIANYYNPQDMGPNGMRAGGANQPNGTGNHALQDYQMQLMLLEQQNKKRLMMARQEQDSMATIPRPDGSGAPGAMNNGQPFQGTSPQGPRSVNSPNPSEQMKRGTPHMNQNGMPSPVPEGQNRGSPSNGMNFQMPGGPMDPQMSKQFYMNGMDPNMVGGGMPNGMRPPSSHPGGAFNNPMAQQQMVLQRQQAQQAQQQAQQQQAGGQNWQSGPNGQMAQPPNQGAPQQNMGTPRQGAMPPPSAPPAGAATNGRVQPPSPQQGTAAPPTPSQTNKANPNKKKTESKDTKAKRAAKKTGTNLTSGATPSADASADGPTPQPPGTPITPVHKGFNGQNGAVQPVTNGQPPAPPANANVAASQEPSLQVGGFGMNENYDYQLPGFGESAGNNMDVLQDFDFDSFLHQDADGVDNFGFDSFPLDDGGQIGAE
ncbi:SOM1 protein [Halenospora varia]|nr:SOM1 protein [Halenospora varia]